ncbi:MAG: hypothetical protein LBD51_07865 [Bifidobacteriaceae bacterium]|nr:hypothetical protein [Bifidobacteriaceae bacterium]
MAEPVWAGPARVAAAVARPALPAAPGRAAPEASTAPAGAESGGSDAVVVSLDDASGLWSEDLTAEFFGDSSWLWTPLDSKAHTVYVRNDSPHVASGEARVVISEPAGGLWDAAVVVGGGSPAWVAAPAGAEVVASAALRDVAPGAVVRVDLWVRVDPGNTLSPQVGVGAEIGAEVVLSGGLEQDDAGTSGTGTDPDPESAPAPTPAASPPVAPSSAAPAGVGGLPVTGAQAAGLAGLAAALLGAGWWLVAAARRRRPDQAGGGS